MIHRLPVRVYYEDTDLAGIVYYANYLKFIERGRSEWVRALGIDQAALKATLGLVFAVRRVEADYLRPARFGDDLTVTTRLREMGGARIVVEQEVLRGAERLFQAHASRWSACRTTATPPVFRRTCAPGWPRPCTDRPAGHRCAKIVPENRAIFGSRPAAAGQIGCAAPRASPTCVGFPPVTLLESRANGAANGPTEQEQA
jgi:acyl-CoA thioester hydrolase